MEAPGCMAWAWKARRGGWICWACMYLVTTLFYQQLDCLVGYDVRTQKSYGLNKNEFLY